MHHAIKLQDLEQIFTSLLLMIGKSGTAHLVKIAKSSLSICCCNNDPILADRLDHNSLCVGRQIAGKLKPACVATDASAGSSPTGWHHSSKASTWIQCQIGQVVALLFLYRPPADGACLGGGRTGSLVGHSLVEDACAFEENN